MTRPKLIIITGPTASGKTALALRLAKKFHGEIVSADSRQIYREMDIGTAKPSKKQLRQIRHHLINIKNPNQRYNLEQFKKDALAAITDILKRGKLPFLVGGTALYIHALTHNLEIPAAKPNRKLRLKLEKQIERRGLNFVYKKLISLDPEAAYIVDENNPRRVVRALEIALTTKQPFSESRKQGPKHFDFLILAPDLPRQRIRQRIAKRTSQMIRQGLIREVKKLVNKYGGRRQAFDAIGYRELLPFLKKKTLLNEALQIMNRNSWHFARRQLAWFRRMPIVWIKTQAQAEKQIKKFLA